MIDDTVKQYADRDSLGLDKAGNYYTRHVQAMTAEGLFTKSDIAGELAFRDYEIDRLRADYEEVLADHRRLVREIDVMINGDGAAEQASLCDLFSQVRVIVAKNKRLRANNEKMVAMLRDCANYLGHQGFPRKSEAVLNFLDSLEKETKP